MHSKKNKADEEFVFEFYEEDYAESLEPVTTPVAEEYNEVNFKADLNEEQMEIVNNIKGPLLIIAGAGSGKTRTISYSVAKLLLSGVRPSEIMLVTFTNKAAKEMIKRVEMLLGKKPKGIWAGTFHSIANRFLRRYTKTIGLKPNYAIMDEIDAKALMKLSIADANVNEIEERFPSPTITKAILSYSINCNLSIRDVILWRYDQFDSENVIIKLKEVYRIYKKKKADDGLLDFDDLLVFWNQLLDEKAVAQLIAKKIKYVLVDEYQDTNFIQDEIIYKIVSQNPERNVMAVGDDAQSIYSFRGANFKNILKFPKKYKDCKIYKITYNYRSVPEILDLANDSIRHNKNQHHKSMKTTRNKGLKPYQVNISDDWEQAKFVANQILSLLQEGYEMQEIAVLYRSGYHSLKIEMELRAKNIPFEVRAGVTFFEKAHIKDLICHLRIIDNPYDEISWSRIFTLLPGLGSASGTKIFDEISKKDDPISAILEKDFFTNTMKGARIQKIGRTNLISHVKKLIGFSYEDPPAEVISDLIKVLEEHIKSKYTNWQDRLDDLKQLSIYAQNYSTIRKFLETLTLNLSDIESKTIRSGSQNQDEKPIILSTIHRAKGLEWRVVFIPMLCEGFFPSHRVIGDAEEFEEERRIFYVAITRAKDLLYLLSPAIIEAFRGHQTVRTSQFISELNSKLYTKSSVEFKSLRKNYKKKKYKAEFKSAFDL